MQTAQPIDRHSSVPYYQQMSTILEARIEAGDITVGTRLPSEHELGSEFGLSRATVRQGLNHLESRGLVQRVPGRGVFAREARADRGWMIQGQESFLEQALGYENFSVSTQVLSYRSTVLPAHACQSLEVPEGSVGSELVRLRSLDGSPALYSVNFSPAGPAAVIADASEVLAGRGSLTGVLAAGGYVLGGAQRTIHALAPSAQIAGQLEVDESTPLLRVRSVSWTEAGERFDIYETWVRTDVLPLEVTVTSVTLPANSR